MSQSDPAAPGLKISQSTAPRWAVEPCRDWASGSHGLHERDHLTHYSLALHKHHPAVGHYQLGIVNRHGTFGHSKDFRADLPQVVIAMAVTRDGVPVRCWTFSGNEPDTAIILTIKDDLAGWNLHRMVWVADRGFASATNRSYLRRGGGHCIHAERLRHTNKEATNALARPGRYKTVASNLRVKEVHVGPGGAGDGDSGARTVRFVICHNPERAERDQQVRTNLVAHLTGLIAGSDDWSARQRDELVGSLKTKPGLTRYLRRTKTGLLRIDQATVKTEQGLDGKWLLRTSDPTLSAEDLAAA